MKDLLYKEYRLGWHPAMFLFLLFGSFLLFPSWPFFIAFGYIFIAFNSKFIVDRANQDVLFTVSLPIRKKDVVLAKTCFIAFIELMQVVAAIPFAVLRSEIYLQGNMAGMNVNFAFFGLVLIMYAVFNIVFLPGFYKTAYKTGGPMVLAVSAVAAYIVAVEVAVAKIPVLRAGLDGMGTSRLTCQLSVLVAGVLLFVLITLLAYRKSANYFEKADL